MNDTSVPSLGAPTIGVTGIHFPVGLVHVLGFARQWCHVVALTADVDEPIDAVVYRHAALLGRRPPTSRPAPRIAVWVDEADDLDHPALTLADVVLSGSVTLVDQVGGRGLLVPTGFVAPDARFVAPHVRARIRAARHLAEILIVEHDGSGWQTLPSGTPLDGELGVTALACASAAVVTDPQLVLEALAWGSPCVTDPTSAAELGLLAKVHALVGDSAAERQRQAQRVALDPIVAAQLSWQGRRLVETAYSPEHTAGEFVRRLGLTPASAQQVPERMAASLAEFDPPADSVLGGRAVAATASLMARPTGRPTVVPAGSAPRSPTRRR